MSDFYNNLANTASGLLKNYGKQLTFTRSVKGTYNPSNGSFASESTTTYKAYGAVLSYKAIEVDGTNILSSDLKLILEKSKKEPQVNDTVVIDSKVYFVISVSPIKPAGVGVVTNCQLRIGANSNEL